MKKKDYEVNYSELGGNEAYCDEAYDYDDVTYDAADENDSEYEDEYESDAEYECEDEYDAASDSDGDDNTDEYGDDYSDYGDNRTGNKAELEYNGLFGSGDKCRKPKVSDPTIPGIIYTREGLPVYSGIYNNNGRAPDATLVHNDLCNAFARIREAGITTLEELQSTDIYLDERNLFNIYGRALRNAVRFMVSSERLRGFIELQHKRSSVVDFDVVTDYAVSMFLFRPSFFECVKNSSYEPEVTARIVMSFVERTVTDAAKFHHVYNPDVNELASDLAKGTVRSKYTAYPVSLSDPVGQDSDSCTRGDLIVNKDSDADFAKVELLSCVESYEKLLLKRKVSKRVIDVFHIKAVTFLTQGVDISPKEISEALGISVQTVYTALKAMSELYKDFAKYLAS